MRGDRRPAADSGNRRGLHGFPMYSSGVMMARGPAKPQPYYETIEIDGERVRRQRTTDGKLGWRLRVWDPRNSKQVEKTFWGDEDAAIRELDRSATKTAQRAAPTVTHAAAKRFAQWVEVWLPLYVWRVQPTRNFPGVRRPRATWAKAAAVMDAWLLPALETVRMARIDHALLVETIGSLLKEDGTPLAPGSKATVASVVRSCFRDAVKEGWIPASPAALLPTVWGETHTSRTALVPSITNAEKLAAALDEVWALPRWARDLAGPNGEGRGDVARLITYTGLRFEELAAVPRSTLRKGDRLLVLEGDTASESGGRREHRERAGKSKAADRPLVLVNQVLPVIDRLDAIRLRGSD